MLPARLAALCLVVAVSLASAGCGGGGGSSNPVPRLPAPSAATASYDPPNLTSTASCPGGTLACGATNSCCPTGTACVANPSNVYGCGSDICCLGCTGGGVECGAGCCASGSSCVANPGGATGCTGNLCCSPTPDPDVCPVDVAATCPGGTKCLKNKSARYCDGGYACYQPTGAVACPGEVMCPDDASFCPAGKYCASVSGVCLHGSAGAGNYCCVDAAQALESCDYRPCADGLTCMLNAHCGGEEAGATNVCRTGTCNGAYPVNCGTYCCSSSYPVCDAPDSCMCWTY